MAIPIIVHHLAIHSLLLIDEHHIQQPTVANEEQIFFKSGRLATYIIRRDLF